MTLFDPDTIINDPFTFEATELKRHVRQKLHDHVRASCNASKVLEILAHQAIARPWVGDIGYTLLLTSSACRIKTLAGKQRRSDVLIPCDVFGP